MLARWRRRKVLNADLSRLSLVRGATRIDGRCLMLRDQTERIMKRGFLICIGIIAIAVTADAQMRYNPPHKKALQTTTTNRAYRSIGRQATPQRRFSSPRFRQPSLSMARPRESRFRTTQIQPSTNTSFGHRPTTFRSAAAPRTTNRQSEINDLLTRPRTSRRRE